MTKALSEKNIWYALCPIGLVGLLKGDLKVRMVSDVIMSTRRCHSPFDREPDITEGNLEGYYTWHLRIIQVDPQDK